MLVRIYCGGVRKRYEVASEKRAEVLRDIARRMSNAGLAHQAEAILRAAATAEDLREVYAAVDLLVARSDVPRETFRSVAEAWSSGDLHRKHPDHVRLKSSLHGDLTRLGVLYETIGNVPIRTFTFADAERAMSALPKTAKASATRRQYAQIISKVLRLSVFPLRLIQHSPLPVRLELTRCFQPSILNPAQRSRTALLPGFLASPASRNAHERPNVANRWPTKSSLIKPARTREDSAGSALVSGMSYGDESDDDPVYGPDAMAEILHRIADEISDDDVSQIQTVEAWSDWLVRKLEFETES